MRISISGPQCCGKTTTLKALKELAELNHYTFIDEPVRRLVKEKGIKINKDASFSDQLMILEEHHKNTFRHADFITDRGVLDAFSYATYDYLHGKYSYFEWMIFNEIFKDSIKRYDRIFLLEPLPMKDDGFRSLDIEWQKETYDIMYDIAKDYDPIILPDWNVEGRIKLFKDNF